MGIREGQGKELAKVLTKIEPSVVCVSVGGQTDRQTDGLTDRQTDKERQTKGKKKDRYRHTGPSVL